MAHYVQQFFNALQVGSIYALIAVGYTMVYGILTMINFAHGDIFMVSTYIAFFVAAFLLGLAVGLPAVLVFGLTLVLAMVLTSLLAVAIERLAYKPLRTAPRVSAVITALGMGIFLETVTLAVIGPEPRQIPPLVPNITYNIGGVSLSSLQIAIIALSVLCMILLDLIVRRTMVGMAMRAISFDKTAVPLMGVPLDTIISATFALGAAIAAVGGTMYGMVYQLDPYMGIRIGWWAFISAVVGGIGNIRGAMIGAFILGFVEIFTPEVLPSTYRDFVAFSLLLILLIFRPTGILGRPQLKKV